MVPPTSSSGAPSARNRGPSWRKDGRRPNSSRGKGPPGRSNKNNEVSKKHNRGKGSLKHQLRGKERLLLKIQAQHDASSRSPIDGASSQDGGIGGSGTTDSIGADEVGEARDTFQSARSKLEGEIRKLKEQIATKDRAELERRNATRYHKIKFFERQKLTRMERKVCRRLEEARALPNDDEKKDLMQKLQSQLDQIRSDQLYVKHFPNDTKYIALFPNGDHYSLHEESEDKINRRLAIRDRIAAKLGERPLDVGDISSIAGSGKETSEVTVVGQTESQQAASRSRSIQNATMSKNRDDCTDGPRDEASARTPKLRRMDKKLMDLPSSPSQPHGNTGDSDSDSDSSSSSSSSSSSTSSSSGSSSGTDSFTDGRSNSSRSPDNEEPQSVGTSHLHATDRNKTGGEAMGIARKSDEAEAANSASSSESDDDFFLENNDGDGADLFERAAQHAGGTGSARHDKSRGWDTQKQRPGQFKKRRVR